MNTYRVVAPAKNQINLESFSLPSVKNKEVLLESLYTTISTGTELAWLQHQPSTLGEYPWYPGYSGTARVLDTGKDVSSLKPGQIVASNMPHSSHVILSETSCHPLIDKQDALEGSAFRLASIALQGVKKAQIQLGEKVAVLGLGAIGNLTAQLSKVAGALEVQGVDLLEFRRKLALECGVDIASEDADDNTFDIVIEATGVPAVINRAFKLARQRGRVILLGSPRGLSSEVDFYTDVHRKGISIVGAHEINRTSHDDLLEQQDHYDELLVLNLLAQKRIQLRPLISDLMSPNDAATAYERLASKEKDLMLVAFDWSKLTAQ